MSSIATRVIGAVDPALARLLVGIRQLEQLLGPEDDWVEDDRRMLFEAADVLLRPIGRPTIREVGSEDYVATIDADDDRVEQLLAEFDYQRNLLSTRKYREHHDGGRQYAVGSWVVDPSDTDYQHHVYLFVNADGSTDLYAHEEPSVTEPAEHHGGDGITHGVPRNLLIWFDDRGVMWSKE